MTYEVIGTPKVEDEYSDEYETTMVIDLRREDGVTGDVWIIAGVPAHWQGSSDAARTQSGYQTVRVFDGGSVDTWCPEQFQVPDEDDPDTYATVRDEILAAVDKVALATHRETYRNRCADRF